MDTLEDYDNSQFLFGSKDEILFADDVEEEYDTSLPKSRNLKQSMP